MVLRPELFLLTLVTGPELTALFQTGVGRFDSGPVLKGIKSSDLCLKQDSQFQSCDWGQFRSKYHGRGLEFRSFCQCRGLMFRSFDQGEEREGCKKKNLK
jgi:hypothetical protein